jgi:hypothetical protein
LIPTELQASLLLSCRALYATLVENGEPSNMQHLSVSVERETFCNEDKRETSSAEAAEVSLFCGSLWTPVCIISLTRPCWVVGVNGWYSCC